MAKIVFMHEEKDCPPYQETIEVRAWGLGGKRSQNFFIGSGINFQASDNVWLEFIYTVNGAQLFYTRNFLHYTDSMDDLKASEANLEKMLQTGEGTYSLYDIMPETKLIFRLEKHRYKDADGQEHSYSDPTLSFTIDVGAVFGKTAPGETLIEIKLLEINTEDAAQFMREIIHEIIDAHRGKHPDPGKLPPGSNQWLFSRQLNQQAYDVVSTDYVEEYFENPLLAQAFDDWIAQLPPGARVLDAGCGHGDPVITRLLAKGMQVTGSDFSPAMLRRARAQFPEVPFIHQATPELDCEAEFDAICSFSSTLYLDPIDLFHSIYRFRKALKPGGLLFLYGYDTHPGWRGAPFGLVLHHWMWAWTYSMEEAAQALEEHGYFRVLGQYNVSPAQEIEDRRARILAERNNNAADQPDQDETSPADTQPETVPGEDDVPEVDPQDLPAETTPAIFPIKKFPFYDPLENLPYQYAIIARRRDE